MALDNSNTSFSRCFLCLGGAFSPVHVGHFQAMYDAAAALKKERPDLTIQGVLFAPAPSGYVKKKLGDQAISAKHRLAMIQLGIQDQPNDLPISLPWIPPQRTYGSASGCLSHLQSTQECVKVIIVGADRCNHKKWRNRNQITLCVGRGEQTRLLRQAYETDVARKKATKGTLIFSDESVGLNISSSQVRTLLQTKSFCQEELSKLVGPQIATYITCNIRNLFQ